jgi:hypothetical protein
LELIRRKPFGTFAQRCIELGSGGLPTVFNSQIDEAKSAQLQHHQFEAGGRKNPLMCIDVITRIRPVQKPDRIDEGDVELRSGDVVDRPPGGRRA